MNMVFRIESNKSEVSYSRVEKQLKKKMAKNIMVKLVYLPHQSRRAPILLQEQYANKLH